MPPIGRRAFTAGSLSLAACQSAAPPREVGPELPSAAGRVDSTSREASSLFAPIVGPTGVGNVIWSWTDRSQISDLERGGPLFSRDVSPTLGVGLVFNLLYAHGRGLASDVAARLKRGRFGWFNPWATSRGFDGESYGDELLRIVLAPDALLMVVETSTLQKDGRVAFCDVAGGAVPAEVAAGARDRVAGIYFTHDAPSARGCRGTNDGGGASPYREVYVGLDAAVATWTARSEVVARDLARFDADLLQLSRRKYSDGGDVCAWSKGVVSDAWTTTPTTPLGRYLSSLAFPTADYVPTRENLEAIRSALAAVPILGPGIGR